METKMKKSQNKIPLQPSELTMYQQIAVEGEVAMLYDNCSEAESACRTFEKLASIDNKLVEVYKSVMSEYTDMELIDTCLYHVHTETIPVYMYANRYIEEIMTLLGHTKSNIRIMEYPLEAVKSKFVQAMRLLTKYLPITGVAVLDQIIGGISKSKSDLDFLMPVIFAIKNNVNVTEADVRLGGKNNPEDNIKFLIKIKILMDTTISGASIMLLSNEMKNKSKNTLLDTILSLTEESSDDEEGTENTLSNEEINNKVEETLADLIKSCTEEEEVSLVYVVKKIDSATGKTVMKWEFSTKDEAVEFVKDTHTNYPEITKRFHFMVELVEE